jgi:hypothetical protein
MILFTKPLNLNGKELREELNAAGVVISYDPDSVVIDGNGALLLDIAESDKSKATPIIAAHNGTVTALEPTTEQKLASVGLSVDDLKAVLGL